MKNKNKTTSNTFNIPKPQKPQQKKTLQKFHLSDNKRENLRERANERLCFSFIYLDIEHEAFNLGKTDVSWFKSLLEVLKDVSDLNRNQLVVTHAKRFNSHGHNFDELPYKYNFEDDFIEQVECRQFDISQANGRVHGFIVGNTFYIVWLDRHHNLYPDDKYGGLTLYDSPMDSYQKLYNQYIYLEKEKGELEEMLEEWQNYMALLENKLENHNIDIKS